MENLLRKNREHTSQVFHSLLLRVTIVALFMAAYRSLSFITECVKVVKREPIVLLLHFNGSSDLKVFKQSYFRTFSIIILCSVLLIPIFKTLTAEISTDTILFHFLICQLVYCIDSVKTAILTKKTEIPVYERHYTIPLEESILIPKKFEYTGAISNVAVAFGFILLFSRIEHDIDLICLQVIGFGLYFFVPHLLEEYKIHYSTMDTLKFLVFTSSLIYFLDKLTFFVFCCIVVSQGVLVSLILRV